GAGRSGGSGRGGTRADRFRPVVVRAARRRAGNGRRRWWGGGRRGGRARRGGLPGSGTTARPAGVGVVARLAPQLPGTTEHLVHRVEHGLGRGGEHIGVDSVLEPQHDRVALDLAYRRLPRHGRGPLAALSDRGHYLVPDPSHGRRVDLTGRRRRGWTGIRRGRLHGGRAGWWGRGGLRRSRGRRARPGRLGHGSGRWFRRRWGRRP